MLKYAAIDAISEPSTSIPVRLNFVVYEIQVSDPRKEFRPSAFIQMMGRNAESPRPWDPIVGLSGAELSGVYLGVLSVEGR